MTAITLLGSKIEEILKWLKSYLDYHKEQPDTNLQLSDILRFKHTFWTTAIY